MELLRHYLALSRHFQHCQPVLARALPGHQDVPDPEGPLALAVGVWEGHGLAQGGLVLEGDELHEVAFLGAHRLLCFSVTTRAKKRRSEMPYMEDAGVPAPNDSLSLRKGRLLAGRYGAAAYREVCGFRRPWKARGPARGAGRGWRP